MSDANGTCALYTERLRLERVSFEHVGPLANYRLRNEEHVRRHEPLPPPEKRNENSYRTTIEHGIAATERGERAPFALFERDGDRIVGSIDLFRIERGPLQCAVLGYSIDSSCVGRGYATEGAGAVVRYAFDDLRLHRLQTSYAPTNERSGRVLRKLGFIVEGYARDYLLVEGTWRDVIFVSLTNANWVPNDA